MSRHVSSGKCRICGQLIGKAQMTKHLKSCVKPGSEAAPAKQGRQTRCFHIVVEAKCDPKYWLHLEVPANTTFGRLDRVLRDIWLECCGHLSAFRFPSECRRKTSGGDYFSHVLARLGQVAWDDEMEEEEQLMRMQVGKKLHKGVKFEYEYDFGSTTHLSLTVVDERPGSFPGGKIRLLARNEPPDIRCVRCGNPATQLCTECEATGGEGAFCAACAAGHECGQEMFSRIVNSPRTGVCGYCGPSIEP